MNDWTSFSYANVHKDAFSADECEDLIRSAERRGFASGDMGDVRKAQISWVFDSPLIERLVAFGADYSFEVAEPFVGAVQVSRYRTGEKYDWHMDLGPGPMSRRKVTVVLELRSADQGGGLEVFAIGDLRLRPGDVAVLPSFIMHRALPVVEGERWSAAVWLLGESPLK